MDYLDDKEFEKYIENKSCRGCYNHCSLLEPNCNRSKIFIKDEYEKYLSKKSKQWIIIVDFISIFW